MTAAIEPHGPFYQTCRGLNAAFGADTFKCTEDTEPNLWNRACLWQLVETRHWQSPIF
jgi:hypothetical protein